ncbi:hypothetical protein TeGR_g9300 [Tetraparma gracilis]|uniref:ER membrane protein complex subunit 7 beta-sandwich domain-containing protein n=1 Tax=Tetraparma gracilis TaxID=2962635 RepID=A0ABQ6N1A3_9STRA|nr:hypothetical protein TeGR_g9300 [Tetraparma gracilis]
MLALLLLGLLGVSLAEPTTTLRGRLVLPPSNIPFPNATVVSLDGGLQTSVTTAAGEFAFYDVAPGVYIIEALSTTHAFSSVKVQLKEDAMDAPNCNSYMFVGAEKKAVVDCATNLELTALATVNYFEKKPPFNIKGLFMNPMLLMMLGGGAMMWYMPKMMEGMDPEQRAQMAKQMEMQSDPSKMFESLFNGDDDDDKKQAQAEPKREIKAERGQKARRGKRD